MDRRRRPRISEAVRERVPAWARLQRQREGDAPVTVTHAEYDDLACQPILDDFADDPPEVRHIRSPLPPSDTRWLLFDPGCKTTLVAAKRVYSTRHRSVRGRRIRRVRLARASGTSSGSSQNSSGDDDPPGRPREIVARTAS